MSETFYFINLKTQYVSITERQHALYCSKNSSKKPYFTAHERSYFRKNEKK